MPALTIIAAESGCETLAMLTLSTALPLQAHLSALNYCFDQKGNLRVTCRDRLAMDATY